MKPDDARDMDPLLRQWAQGPVPSELYDPELEALAHRWQKDGFEAARASLVASDGDSEILEALDYLRATSSSGDDPQEVPRASRLHGWRCSLRTMTTASAALAASIAAVIWVVLPADTTEGSAETLTMKGSTDQLFVAVERQGRRFTLAPGESLHTGDRFGLFYSARHSGYVIVLHRGEDQKTTLLLSAEGSPVAAGHKQALPVGGRVQDVTACEWLVAVFTENPPTSPRGRRR